MWVEGVPVAGLSVVELPGAVWVWVVKATFEVF